MVLGDRFFSVHFSLMETPSPWGRSQAWLLKFLCYFIYWPFCFYLKHQKELARFSFISAEAHELLGQLCPLMRPRGIARIWEMMDSWPPQSNNIYFPRYRPDSLLSQMMVPTLDNLAINLIPILCPAPFPWPYCFMVSKEDGKFESSLVLQEKISSQY